MLAIESFIKIGELFHVYCRISVETDNHFESNAASATDKENDMRHIPRGMTHQSMHIHCMRGAYRSSIVVPRPLGSLYYKCTLKLFYY